MENSIECFFELVQAGLWGKEARLLPFGDLDFLAIQKIAEDQSVVGLVAAGLEHVSDLRVPKKDVLQFVGQTLQLEQRNKAMNYFIGIIVEKMREAGIYTTLVKGQGVAQCYTKPAWRACGDVDFFLDPDNYEKAKAFLVPMATSVEQEGKYTHHLGMTIDQWAVELHGTMRCGLSLRLDRCIDEIQEGTFTRGEVRVWDNDGTVIFLPSPDNDACFIFTHFLKHYYIGGIGLRQICDWCRLLWTYRSEINKPLLYSRLREMELLSEWKAFGAFSVEYLGMPPDAMPFYSSSNQWRRKAKRIKGFILKSGNFGHNRDFSYFQKYPYLIRKSISMCRRIGDLCHHAIIFPLNSLRFFPRIMINGLGAAARGE